MRIEGVRPRIQVESPIELPRKPEVPNAPLVEMDGKRGGNGSRAMNALEFALAVIDGASAVVGTADRAGGEPHGAILGNDPHAPRWLRAIDAHLTHQAATGGGITDIVQPVAEAIVSGDHRGVWEVIGDTAGTILTNIFEDAAGGPVLFLATAGASSPDLWIPQPGSGPLAPPQGDGTDEGEDEPRGRHHTPDDRPVRGRLLPAEDDTPEHYTSGGPWRPRAATRRGDESTGNDVHEKGGDTREGGVRGQRADDPAPSDDAKEPQPKEPNKKGKDPKKLPADPETGGGGQSDLGPNIPHGAPDTRSGLERVSHPSVRLFEIATGADDRDRVALPRGSGEVATDPTTSGVNDLGPRGLRRGPATIQVGPFAPRFRFLDPGDPAEGF